MTTIGRAKLSVPSKSVRHMFDTFSKKGAINKPSCQRMADKYFFYLRDLMSESELANMTKARSCALQSGGVENVEVFSKICKQIESRIWKEVC